MYIFLIFFLSILFSPDYIEASGAFPVYSDHGYLIGKNRSYILGKGETLIELARMYDTGYNEIVDANKNIDPWVPGKGTAVTIPTSWLLPELIDNGIIINLAELRLYFFFSLREARYIKTYPIGIGREGFNTPTGDFSITLKMKDPIWKVPETSRRENPELPLYVLPGPDNPLGEYWLQLSVDTYGIHGTNRPYGIGRRVSQGCIRLYPEDIKDLYNYVTPGTPVKIISEPVKVGIHNDQIYIEVHASDLTESELINMVIKKLHGKHLLKDINTALMIKSIKSATGLPALISN
ncbi:MAG: L,D-transpeptidase family protein [Nitrospiraceae bacterium]|nr:MAG: L,D-transpeptidase family protein [Nitrospiraceae bacterium]